MSTILNMNHVYKDFYSLDEERQIHKDINFCGRRRNLSFTWTFRMREINDLKYHFWFTEPTQGSVDTRKIGYMFQKDHLFEWRTIMKNITLGLEIQHKLTNEAQEEIKRLLEIYDL